MRQDLTFLRAQYRSGRSATLAANRPTTLDHAQALHLIELRLAGTVMGAFRTNCRSGALALAAFFLCTQSSSCLSISDAYTDLSLSLPTQNRIVICHGFGCAFRTSFGSADVAKLAELLAPGRRSAAAERRAIASASAWFDLRIGPAASTTHRVARAGAFTERGSGQMDCIDLSRNNTSLFLVMEQLNLLRHHKVEAPEARGFLLDGRGPHATAVLRDVHTGQKWAFDSWTHKYGGRPDVMPLDQWMVQR
jgi:hypothetical protein